VAPSVRHVRPAGRSGAVVGPRLTVSAARAADEELVIEGAIARALVIGVLQRSLEEAGRSGRQSLAECAPAAGAARPAAPRCCALARARLGAGRRGHRGGPASRTAGRRGRRAEAAPCLHERRAGTKACAPARRIDAELDVFRQHLFALRRSLVAHERAARRRVLHAYMLVRRPGRPGRLGPRRAASCCRVEAARAPACVRPAALAL